MGTALGTTYAGLFPDKIGCMVLDGALDPALSNADYGLGQAASVEGALCAYVTNFQAGTSCPTDRNRGRRPRADREPARQRAEAAALEAVAPTIGYFFGYNSMICADWPYPPTGKTGAITADGAAPIVVIGTTNDPATPYAWAENLAGELSSGVLLTYDGEGHTAYGRSNECILDAVDTYLVTGTPPASGTRC